MNVSVNASIQTYGTGSTGIISHSTTDPIITIVPGVSGTGGPGGSALRLDSPVNQITNAGHLTTRDGAAGQTVRTLSGDTTFTNKGVLTGSVTLAQGGANTLRNLAEGTIDAGTSLDLGGGTLHNAGLLGNGGALGKTVITGSLIQSDTASLRIRLDQKTGAADSFAVTGTGKLAGQLRPTILDLTTIKPGTFVRTILTAAETLDVSGLRIGSSAILGHVLGARDGKLSFATTIDFAPQALSRSGRVIGQVIANAQNAGQGHFRSMLPRLVGLVQHGDLDQAYYNLSGAGTSAVSTVGTQMSNAFMTSLVRQPGGSDRSQTWNLWGRDLGGLSQTSTRGVGMGTLSTRLGGQALGIDARPDKDTLAGLAVSVGSTSFSTSNWVNGRSDVYQFGLYGVKRVEAAYLAGALSFGSHDTVLDRMLPLTGTRYSSRFRGWHYGARLETGYRLETEVAGLAPYGALQVQDFRTPASTETAAGPQLSAAGLRFDRRSTWDTRFELGAARDRTFTLDGNRDLTLRASAAWLHRASSNPDVVAGFQAAKADRFSVDATAPVSDLALLSADLGLNLTPNLFVGVRVESELADRSHVFSGTGRVNYRW